MSVLSFTKACHIIFVHCHNVTRIISRNDHCIKVDGENSSLSQSALWLKFLLCATLQPARFHIMSCSLCLGILVRSWCRRGSERARE